MDNIEDAEVIVDIDCFEDSEYIEEIDDIGDEKEIILVSKDRCVYFTKIK